MSYQPYVTKFPFKKTQKKLNGQINNAKISDGKNTSGDQSQIFIDAYKRITSVIAFTVAYLSPFAILVVNISDKNVTSPILILGINQTFVNKS